MLSLIIILVLVYGTYVGVRRGLMMQLFYTIGYGISFGLAVLGYRSFGPHLNLIIPYPSALPKNYFAFFSKKAGLGLDTAFYFGVAFLIILFVGWMITRFIGVYFHNLTYYPMNARVNDIGGGILAFICNYIGIFVIIYVLALIPVDSLQHMLNNSFMTNMMVHYSIGLTDLFTNLLINIV